MTRSLAAALLLLLGGCAANAQTRPAYVDVRALIPRDPLYPALAQYDRQISALSATLQTGFSQADAAIAHAGAAVHAIALQRSPVFPALPAPPVAGAGCIDGCGAGRIRDRIAQTYAQQRQEVRSASSSDLARYRAALLAQERAAYDAFVTSLHRRTQQALATRGSELAERESTMLLDLARAHAEQRLNIRARLQTLALRPAQRAELAHRLAELQAQENAQLAVARSADTATLNAYAARLNARAASDARAFSAELQRRTTANLRARLRVAASQSRQPDALALPRAAAPALGARPMQSLEEALARGAAPQPDFAPLAADLSRQWSGLRAAHDAATTLTESQIASLRHDRQAVVERITAQIMREAERIASAQGYSRVLAGPPARGAADITPQVAASLKNLTP